MTDSAGFDDDARARRAEVRDGVTLLVASAPRLPDRAHGIGGFGDSMPWSVVVGLAVLWSLGTVVVGAAALYARRGVAFVVTVPAADGDRC